MTTEQQHTIESVQKQLDAHGVRDIKLFRNEDVPLNDKTSQDLLNILGLYFDGEKETLPLLGDVDALLKNKDSAMTEQQHTITIPGLPEGWRAVAYRRPVFGEYYFYNDDIQQGKTGSGQFLIVEKIKPRRVVLEETWRWHINSTEGYVLVPAGSLIDMIDTEESQPDWMCYKVVKEE